MKDLNYVAKLEKAIAEKYGEEAIINPKSLITEKDNKDFLENQLKFENISKPAEKINIEGILVSKKLFINKNKNVCCVCKKYSLNKKDDVYLTKFETCLKCFIEHIEDREERWQKGWRPQNG